MTIYQKISKASSENMLDSGEANREGQDQSGDELNDGSVTIKSA